MNTYAYVGGDPVNFVDPTGLCKSYIKNTYDAAGKLVSFMQLCGSGGGGGGGAGTIVVTGPGRGELGRALGPGDVRGVNPNRSTGRAGPSKGRPQKTQPKACNVGLNQFGEGVAEVGEFVENVGYGLAVAGAVTGVGGGGGLAVAAVGDVIQGVGYLAQFAAGDRNAGAEFLASLLPGPEAVVPQHLRNDLGDALSDAAYGQATGATSPNKPGC